MTVESRPCPRAGARLVGWDPRPWFDTGRGGTSRLVLSHAHASHLQAASPGGPHRSHAHPPRTGIRGRSRPGRAGRSVDGRAGHPSRRLPGHPVPAVWQPTTSAPRARPCAAAAGVSRATLYRLVPGKEALFAELVRRFSPFEPIAAVLETIGDRSPVEVIPAIAQQMAAP